MNLLKLIVTVVHICSQKRVEDLTIFFKNQQCTCERLCSCTLNIASNILKSKESPPMIFERTKRDSQPEFTNQDLYIKMIMSYREIKIFFHKFVDLKKKKTSDFSTF